MYNMNIDRKAHPR